MQNCSKITDIREAVTRGYANIPFINVFIIYKCANRLHNIESMDKYS